MIPIRYTKYKNGKIKFHYDKRDYKIWKSQGDRYGSVGPMLDYLDKPFMSYKTYGTLNNPCTTMTRVTLEHNVAFEGKWKEPEFYLKEATKKRIKKFWNYPSISYKFVIMNMSNNDGKI